MTNYNKNRIGIAGLGREGAALARRLHVAGYEISGYCLDSARAFEANGASVRLCPTPDELTDCRIVLLTADSPADLETVVFGRRGLLSGPDTDLLVVDLSGGAPDRTRDFAGRAAGLGARWVDAHWSGGPSHQQSGLTVVLGGSSPDLDEAAWLFTTLGCRCTQAGGVGDGHAVGLVETAIVYGQQALSQEIEVLITASGLNPNAVRGQLTGSLADMSILDVTTEVCPGQAGSLSTVRRYADSVDVALPITSSVLELYR